MVAAILGESSKTREWLEIFAWNTPPLDLIEFARLLREGTQEIDLHNEILDEDMHIVLNRKTEIFGFLENVIVYFVLGLVFGLVFQFMEFNRFLNIMLIIWSIAYPAGILADVLLIHYGTYIPMYNKLKGTKFRKLFKLFGFTIYRSALYVIIGVAIGRFLL